MKQVLGWCACTIVAALIAFLAMFGCVKSGVVTLPQAEANSIGAVDIQMSIDSIVNPVFYSSAEAMDYQETLVSNAHVDSCFMHMPPTVLRNVSNVCIKRSPFPTKADIVAEYTDNRAVYDNLPAQSTSNDQLSTTNTTEQKGKTTTAEGSHTEVGNIPTSTEYNIRDSMIDGKKAKVTTKIEKYE